MDSYKIDTSDEGDSISLGDDDGTLKPMPPTDPGYRPEEQAKLSQILKALNKAFGTDFTDADRLLVSQITGNMLSDDELMSKVKNNPRENVEAIFDKFFNRELVQIFNSNENFYNKISTNEELRDQLKKDLLDFVYSKQVA